MSHHVHDVWNDHIRLSCCASGSPQLPRSVVEHVRRVKQILVQTKPRVIPIHPEIFARRKAIHQLIKADGLHPPPHIPQRPQHTLFGLCQMISWWCHYGILGSMVRWNQHFLQYRLSPSLLQGAIVQYINPGKICFNIWFWRFSKKRKAERCFFFFNMLKVNENAINFPTNFQPFGPHVSQQLGESPWLPHHVSNSNTLREVKPDDRIPEIPKNFEKTPPGN